MCPMENTDCSDILLCLLKEKKIPIKGWDSWWPEVILLTLNRSFSFWPVPDSRCFIYLSSFILKMIIDHQWFFKRNKLFLFHYRIQSQSNLRSVTPEIISTCMWETYSLLLTHSRVWIFIQKRYVVWLVFSYFVQKLYSLDI